MSKQRRFTTVGEIFATCLPSYRRRQTSSTGGNDRSGFELAVKLAEGYHDHAKAQESVHRHEGTKTGSPF